MKVTKLLSLALMVLCITLASCQKDGASTSSGGGSHPGNITNCDDPEGTITANLRNDSGYLTILDGTLKMNTADNFVFDGQSYHTRTFVNIGEVDGLGCVDNIPELGWSNQVAVIPGNGYIVKDKYDNPDYPDGKYTKYARIYVTRYILSVNNEILGAELKYQDNWNVANITTKEITNITASTATSGGIIEVVDGLSVANRGLCWSTNDMPCINDYTNECGSGDGHYDGTITGLLAGVTYYVRAYAITNDNNVYYGDVKSFTANITIPTVATLDVKYITSNSALCYGQIVYNGGDDITSQGVCWSVNPNPTLDDNYSDNSVGSDYYYVKTTGLDANESYYVRAYATNSCGTAYGDVAVFKTCAPVPNGAITGVFSVSDTKKVYFSKGNLQYQASTNTWRFAENQWVYAGEDNAGVSETYNGWIDLFGWGTSGYNHGAVCFQPWSVSDNNSNYYAYGNQVYNLYDQTGQADWGYNAISNADNQVNKWHTMTINEFHYLFGQRNTKSGVLFAMGRVDGTNGILVLPDDWESYYYELNNVNSWISYNSNVISMVDWVNNFESNGAVFLPSAGFREGDLQYINSYGIYWTSDRADAMSAYSYAWGDDPYGYNYLNSYRGNGFSVRLVRDVN